jgi:carbamate kinase
MTTVVALGGNGLVRPGERGTAAEQRARIRETCESLKPLFRERRLVVTHGNGPQVGQMLTRQERAADEVPPLPLYLTVAETQATIGALLVTELTAAAGRPAACLLTRVVVDPTDPAFGSPTKPIGPFYSEEQARALERNRGWQLEADAGRGWRRVVPSPAPVEVLELGAIGALLDAKTIAVACGGGGIPVAARNGALRGVDAVIDKDAASALLAVRLRAKRLVILTDVDAVVRGYGTPEAVPLAHLSPLEAETLMPELAEGSMRPKVQAALDFVRQAKGEALIASHETLADALEGRAGTRVG